jgi:hypothetical protein
MSSKQTFVGDCSRGGFWLSRFVGAICALVLVSLQAKYLNALVMSRVDSKTQAIPITLLVLVSSLSTPLQQAMALTTTQFTLTFIYLGFSIALFLGTPRKGQRFLAMATIDFTLLIMYLLGVVKLGLGVAAISCKEEQFQMYRLNRYGMGYFDSEHTLQSWAKSSYQHCQSAKAIWVMCLILSIVFLCSGILFLYIYNQSWRGLRAGKGNRSLDDEA